MTQAGNDRADETRGITMGKHRTPDGQQSTSERNGGPKHDTGREPRHAAQETTPLDDREARAWYPGHIEGRGPRS